MQNWIALNMPIENAVLVVNYRFIYFKTQLSWFENPVLLRNNKLTRQIQSKQKDRTLGISKEIFEMEEATIYTRSRICGCIKAIFKKLLLGRIKNHFIGTKKNNLILLAPFSDSYDKVFDWLAYPNVSFFLWRKCVKDAFTICQDYYSLIY